MFSAEDFTLRFGIMWRVEPPALQKELQETVSTLSLDKLNVIYLVHTAMHDLYVQGITHSSPDLWSLVGERLLQSLNEAGIRWYSGSASRALK